MALNGGLFGILGNGIVGNNTSLSFGPGQMTNNGLSMLYIQGNANTQNSIAADAGLLNNNPTSVLWVQANGLGQAYTPGLVTGNVTFTGAGPSTYGAGPDSGLTHKIIPNVVANNNATMNSAASASFAYYDPTLGVVPLATGSTGNYYYATTAAQLLAVTPAQNLETDANPITFPPQTLEVNSWLHTLNNITGSPLGGSEVKIDSGAVLLPGSPGATAYVGATIQTNPLSLDFNAQTAYATLASGTNFSLGREIALSAKIQDVGPSGLVLSGQGGNVVGLRNLQNNQPQTTVQGMVVPGLSAAWQPFQVNFPADAALGQTGGTATIDNAILNYRTTTEDVAEPLGTSITVNRPLVLANSYLSGLAADNAGSVLTWAGSIGGPGRLWIFGNGTTVLSNSNNSFTGGAWIGAGEQSLTANTAILSINSDANLGTAPAAPVVDSIGIYNNCMLQITGNTTINPNRGIALGWTAYSSDGPTVQNATLEVTGGNAVTYNGAMINQPGVIAQFIKLGTGTLKLGGSNTYSGSTFVYGGNLTLDFTAPNAPSQDILYNNVPANGLVFNNNNWTPGNTGVGTTYTAGSLTILGSAGAANSQNFYNLTLNSVGAAQIALVPGSGGTVALNFWGPTLTRNVRSTLNFDLPSGATVHFVTAPTLNQDGLIGNWATVTSGGTAADFATLNGAGNVVPVGAPGAAANYVNNTWAPGFNTNVTTSLSLTGSATNTLHFATPAALSVTLAGNNTLGTGAGGGIVVAGAVGANNVTLSGGTLQTGLAASDLVVAQYNTQGRLIINSVISDNGTSNLNKSGPGTLQLGAANTFAGFFDIDQGTVELNYGGSSTAGVVAAGATVNVTNGSTLRGLQTDPFGWTAASPNGLYAYLSTITQAAGTHATLGMTTLNLTGGTLTSDGAGNLAGGGNYIFDTPLATGASDITSVINATGVLLRSGSGKGGVSGGTFNVAKGATTVNLLVSSNIGTMSGFTVGLTKTGLGLMLVTGSNTYNGGTAVNQGTLRIGSNNSLPGGLLTVAGGLLDMQTYNATVGTLSVTSGSIQGTGTITLADSGSLYVNNAGGVVITPALAGSGLMPAGLVKNGVGTLTLAGANTYAGATSLLAGTTILDFTSPSATTNNILPSGGTLNLYGAGLTMVGKGTSSQTLGATKLVGGVNSIGLTNYAGDTPVLNLGTVTRSNYATANFTSPTGGSLEAGNANNAGGTMGGWAVATTSTAMSWAVQSGGNVVALTNFAVNDFTAATNNVNVTTAAAIGDAATTVNSLRFNTAGVGSVTLQPNLNIPNPTLVIASGGILATANVGSYSPTISGGTLEGAGRGRPGGPQLQPQREPLRQFGDRRQHEPHGPDPGRPERRGDPRPGQHLYRPDHGHERQCHAGQRRHHGLQPGQRRAAQRLRAPRRTRRRTWSSTAARP